MKKYITLSLILLLTVSYAQNKSTEKADKLFESYQYIGAIDEYLKLADSKNANQYVYTQLAESYYNVFNTSEASKWYAKATKEKNVAEIYYHYAETLKVQGKYQEANKQMDIFASLSPNDSRAKEHKANPNYIPSLANKSKMFDIAETNIKSNGQSDFGAVLTNENTLYFVSTRNSSKKTDKWINQPYLDIFKATRSESGTFSEPTSVSELNTAYHDGPVTISSDGNTMYFARDGHSEGQYENNKSTKTKIGQQGLYKATKKDGKWTQIEALPFNSTSYSITHPSLSKDGKTLYFASNMPNSLGESDIWKVSIEANGYGKPQNLGPNVNTPGKENFPFITDDNTLYFASSGKQGFGGLDVFKVDLNKKEEAQNVGKPVNSEKDDFSLSFNTTANVGYFASNRNGTDAIFAATPVCVAEAIAVVSNKQTGAILTNATVSILDTKGNTIETKQTNSEGKVSYDIECQTAYTFVVKADNFETESFPIQKTKSGQVIVQAQLVPSEVIITETEVILKNVYFDFDKSNITAQGANELDKLVKVMKENPSMVIFVKSHTDSKGKSNYNIKLSERRAQSTVQYLLSKGITKDRVSGKGFGNSEPKIKCEPCSEEENAQNRRSEFVIVKK
ncbi:OmpA family protein [Flavobacterium sp. RSB2_4_14]|uniref:OmpA family protein n=1 Tax=Flavobacterium sp. RSB2_4_14 TaxID=3447665 RepID=UPI003F3F578B